MTRPIREAPQFYLTAASPCPYLPGREERKVFTHLVGAKARELNDLLTHGGFRRSQTIAYRPACETCRACISIRVLVDEFSPGRTQRRTQARNADLIGATQGNKPTSEQYSLFRALSRPPPSGGGHGRDDGARLRDDGRGQPCRHNVIEYRQRGPDSGITGRGHGDLIGMSLTDRMADGLSMVYSFYDPQHADRSLGTWMILDHIERAKKLGLPYLYLGYWVQGSQKMDYKARFLPQERLLGRGWSGSTRSRGPPEIGATPFPLLLSRKGRGGLQHRCFQSITEPGSNFQNKPNRQSPLSPCGRGIEV